jgi:hypothetical protein
MSQLNKPRTTAFNKHLNYPEHYTKSEIDMCKKSVSQDKIITIYRGMAFKNESDFKLWANDEITLFNENNDGVSINTNILTSWSIDKKVALNYANGRTLNNIDELFASCLLSLDINRNKLFCDLDQLQVKTKEVLLYSGIYKCKIEFFKSQMYKEVNIDIDNDKVDIDIKSRDNIFIDNQELKYYKTNSLGNIYHNNLSKYYINGNQSDNIIGKVTTNKNIDIPYIFAKKFYELVNVKNIYNSYECTNIIENQNYKYIKLKSEPEVINFRNISLGKLYLLFNKITFDMFLGNPILEFDADYNFKHCFINKDNNVYKINNGINYNTYFIPNKDNKIEQRVINFYEKTYPFTPISFTHLNQLFQLKIQFKEWRYLILHLLKSDNLDPNIQDIIKLEQILDYNFKILEDIHKKLSYKMYFEKNMIELESHYGNPNTNDISKNMYINFFNEYDDSLDLIKRFCINNIEFCKNINIYKILIEYCQIDYMDPNNFIYKYNQIKNYKEIQHNYNALFILYMKDYYKDIIICENLAITSFPYYPNMTEFHGYNNQLTSFPIQPNMTEFRGYNNQLTSFPIQPNMEEFRGEHNQLTSFPIQPKMKNFDGNNNQLTSFPIQPEMTYFNGVDNQLTSFPIQPKMEEFYGHNNQLTSFPIQPKMKNFHGHNNQLTSFPSQPNMIRFSGPGNQLTSFPVQPNMTSFNGNSNQLTSFPSQPNMIRFSGPGNQLTSFPVQPNMTSFNGNSNQLTSFPIQHNMTHFNGDNNQLTSFPIQPNMTSFYGNNNQLTSFPIQPNMIQFHGKNNQLTSFPIQPKMTYFSGNDNQLTSFPIQPELTYFSGNDNQLTSFPVQPKMTEFNGKNNPLTSFPIQPKMTFRKIKK